MFDETGGGQKERFLAAKTAAQKLVADYGFDFLKQALEEIESEARSSKTEERFQSRLRDLLYGSGVSFFLSSSLKKGDRILNVITDREGYTNFEPQGKPIDPLLRSNLGSGPLVLQYLNAVVEQKSREEPSLGCVLLRAAGSDQASLGLTFRQLREDSFHRTGQSVMVFSMPSKDAEEVLGILKSNDLNESLQLFQDRIDPNLSSIAPAPRFKQFKYMEVNRPAGYVPNASDFNVNIVNKA